MEKKLGVVIIDDEPIIVEGLTKIMPWERYGCEIIGTAYDGNEGTRVIREKKPDILFTDIAMPGRDGLTMIAGLRSEFPHMQISILTGYRDFDYAREAIRLGVTRFLLKPSNMEELNDAVEEMTRRRRMYLGIVDETETTEDRTLDPNEPADRTEEQTEGGEADDKASPEQNVAGSFVVKKAVEYIQANYKERLSLSDVADNVYVSQWHLSKLLNKHLGKSFLEVLNQARIDASKELLRDPSLRIGDVADAVGFLDFAHFSRVFKKLTGVSPNEYRNSL